MFTNYSCDLDKYPSFQKVLFISLEGLIEKKLKQYTVNHESNPKLVP